MRRRTFLAALGASTTLAGCTSAPGTSGPGATTDGTSAATESPTDDSPTTTTEDDRLGGGRIGAASIVDLETTPLTYALSPLLYHSDDGAEVTMEFAETATADHPARLVAELRNANEFGNTFRLDWTPPFGRLVSDIPRRPWEDYPAGHTYRATLVFAPTENHDLVDDPPAVERDGDGLWRLTEGVDQWLPETVRLDPGEVVRGEYAVVGHPDGAGTGRPTGFYEFSRGQDNPLRLAVWNTDEPGPERDSRFADESVPALPGESEVAWYHEADASTPSYVRPSAERASLPAKVEFTFVNHAREAAQCGHWNLYKLHGGEWFHLGPYVQTADCRIVRPGGAKTWPLRAGSGEVLPCDHGGDFGYLGGGRYAAVAGYGHATPRSAALVELVGDPVEIVPTADVTTERDDGTVTVTSPAWDDADGRRRRATLALTRADRAETELVPEQVMRERYRGLRNTLAFAEEDVERVVLRTNEHVAERAVGYDNDVRRFSVDGQAYRVGITRRDRQS